MSRPQALAVGILLALAAASGAWAVGSTNALRGKATKPEVASSQALAKRAKQLDAWEASLAQALRSRPPALPAVPRYAAPARVRVSGSGTLPALVLSRTSTAPQPHRASRGRTAAVVRSHARPRAGGSAAAPVVAPAPATDDPAPSAPAAAPVASTPPAAAPQPAPAQAASAPQPVSVEQQCEQLKKAAEGKGEAAQRAAEKQCEQLKQAAEGQSGQDDGGHD
ncbi:MAG: hypothetical protein ACXVZP_12690 [Gaiellaceae bacterium]